MQRTQPVRHNLWPRKYIKYQTAQNGTSYKAKLKAAIDRLIPTSSSLEDLLARLQREGYEIKRGEYISARVYWGLTKLNDFVGEGGATERVSFSPQGGNERYTVSDDTQERFTRLKTLSADYTEEASAARIAGGPRPSIQPKQRSGKVTLLIDIQNSIRAQQSAGYQR
ncbi:Uncharacterised protein [uncultured Oscillibacter sp.]|nr:Uncharacterised protein [uncultured Oscillibacter sp.]